MCGLTGKFIKTWVAFPQIPGKQAARAVSHLTDPRTAISGDPTDAAAEREDAHRRAGGILPTRVPEGDYSRAGEPERESARGPEAVGASAPRGWRFKGSRNRLVARVATLLSSFICGSSTIRIIILPKSAVPVALAEQQFTP